MADLMQHGFIGVHYGLQRYRLEEQGRLGACLAHSIHEKIKHALIEEFPNRPYKIPTDIIETMYQADTVAARHYREHGRRLSLDELVETLMCMPPVLPHYKYEPTKKARIRFAIELRRELAQPMIPYDGPLGAHDSIIPGKTPPQETTHTEDAIVGKLTETKLTKQALDHLRNPHKTIMQLRYGLDTNHAKTYKEIAAVFGRVDHQGFQQYEARTLKKLRRHFSKTLMMHDREAILEYLRR